MRKRAVIVHINALIGAIPLVGGYLKAFALADREIAANWEIELYNAHVDTSASEVIRHLLDTDPDLVAFSVYTWNSRLVRQLLPALRGLLRPETRFLIGGVDVMHHAHEFLAVPWDGLAVCNGEGEKTFRRYLLEATEARPDLANVMGLSVFQDGAWQTSEPYERIRDLGEIPSPWLSGVFDDVADADIALFETNRGCPYSCAFCYWGGAVGQKVYRLTDERIKDEIDYLARRGYKTLSIVDANFGILPRDVALAEHIVEVSARRRYPNQVLFSAAKNNADRVEQITRILHGRGLLNSQTVSLQTLNPRALALADRDNIKNETYLRLQRRLNEWDIASLIELIWPLPGETLESFKDGVDYLCARGAQGFAVYPLLWLNNAGYTERIDELGVVTLDSDEPAGSAKAVIQTKEVRYDDYVHGILFATALYILHDLRGLYLTMQVLNALEVARFRDVLDAYSSWMSARTDGPIADMWQDARAHSERTHRYIWRGNLAYAVLHLARRDVDEQLATFVGEHPEWVSGGNGGHHDIVRAALEFDLLSRPCLFVQTPLDVGIELEQLRVVERKRSVLTVDSPFDFPRMVRELRTTNQLSPESLCPGLYRFTIDHRKGLVFRIPSRTEEEHAWYCYLLSREIGNTEARYETVEKHQAGVA